MGITMKTSGYSITRPTTLWDIPIGTTFRGTIIDRTNLPVQRFQGLFLRGTGWVCQLNPDQNHVGWSLSERDHKGKLHRDIKVLFYRPVNITIDVQ